MRKRIPIMMLILVVVMAFTVLTGCERPDFIPDPADEIQVEDNDDE